MQYPVVLLPLIQVDASFLLCLGALNPKIGSIGHLHNHATVFHLDSNVSVRMTPTRGEAGGAVIEFWEMVVFEACTCFDSTGLAEETRGAAKQYP